MNKNWRLTSFFAVAFILTYTVLVCAEIEKYFAVPIRKLPHVQPAFTQGLAMEDNVLFESTGMYGQSCLRELDISTGSVKRQIDLPASEFGEGLAVISNIIYQLTWREQKVIAYDRSSFKQIDTFAFSGEGWGLCRDGDTMWMSNGSHLLVQRSTASFDSIKVLDVFHNGCPAINLNDLECDRYNVYANVYGQDYILRIDKATGKVNGIIDASALLLPEEKKKLNAFEVLNGIAYREETNTFFLTGKGWPWIFEVCFSKRPS